SSHGNTQSIVLNTTPVAGQAVTITIGGILLASGDFSISGRTLTITRTSGLTAGDTLDITYTGPVLHSRRENVLVASQTTPGAFVQARTETVTPKLTFGDDPLDEPFLYRGGEQAYYSKADPVQQNADVSRITVTGSGMPGDIIYTGLGSVSLSLGSGNDLVTVETTHTGSTSISTGGGNDRVAVRDTHGDTTVTTGDGNDTVYVGSEAGLWHTTQVPSVTADANGNKFLNVLGDANEIRAALTVDGGDGTDVVTVDDT